MVKREQISQRWEVFGSKLDERGRRLFAAAESRAAGRGGLAAVAQITGLARSTIGRGLNDLRAFCLNIEFQFAASAPQKATQNAICNIWSLNKKAKRFNAPGPGNGRVRRKGAGRREVADLDATLVSDLQGLAEPATMGDPMRPLKWVSKSPAKLAAALCEAGHAVCANTVAKLLETKLEYSRQVNRKTHEGTNHPDRDAQFEHINASVLAAQAAGQPVISVDTKKKEMVGNYRNGGSDYRPKGDPTCVNMHDFPDKELGKVVPYGVYDVGTNTGWVSVGVTADTASFAVNSIRTWRQRMGLRRHPDMRELTITADCGGSNGARVRLWKVELQKFADETGLVLHVHHYPPGTSKWNRIEHRLFCHITQNWRGRPLSSRMVIVELIGATTTNAGLKVECALDEGIYVKGIKITNAEMDSLAIEGDVFHPEWNYTINPRRLN